MGRSPAAATKGKGPVDPVAGEEEDVPKQRDKQSTK
jgi:hypothetical protein